MEREWGNEEEMERKWGNGERLTLYISSFSLYFLPLSPFPPSLSISYIKMHHILLQNVKYGTFVANVTKISTYALWGNNSGSNLLRGSSAIRAGLVRVWGGQGYPNKHHEHFKVIFSITREEIELPVKIGDKNLNLTRPIVHGLGGWWNNNNCNGYYGHHGYGYGR